MRWEFLDLVIEQEFFTTRFSCDIEDCKGSCCVDGAGGPLLLSSEASWIKKYGTRLMGRMEEDSRIYCESESLIYHSSFGSAVSCLPSSGACVFCAKDKSKFWKCIIQESWDEGIAPFEKPLSCHLFPIVAESYPGGKTLLKVVRRELCKKGYGKGPYLIDGMKIPLIRLLGEDQYRLLRIQARRFQKSEG
jgi:hypothetical protein